MIGPRFEVVRANDRVRKAITVGRVVARMFPELVLEHGGCEPSEQTDEYRGDDDVCDDGHLSVPAVALTERVERFRDEAGKRPQRVGRPQEHRNGYEAVVLANQPHYIGRGEEADHIDGKDNPPRHAQLPSVKGARDTQGVASRAGPWSGGPKLMQQFQRSH